MTPDTLLADALRKLVVLADRHEPEWLPDAVRADYRATVLAGRMALLEHDERPIAPLTVLQEPTHPSNQLALVA